MILFSSPFHRQLFFVYCSAAAGMPALPAVVHIVFFCYTMSEKSIRKGAAHMTKPYIKKREMLLLRKTFMYCDRINDNLTRYQRSS